MLVVQELEAAGVVCEQETVGAEVEEHAGHEHEARVVQKQAVPVVAACTVQPHQGENHQPRAKANLQQVTHTVSA